MAKKGSILATVLLVAIVVVLFWGALNSGTGGGGEGEGSGGGLLADRVPFVTWLSIFLAFVAGFGLRDSVARWLANRPRPAPPGGRKPA